jgi:asparagine synthase (glutamine-hydrolysing)
MCGFAGFLKGVWPREEAGVRARLEAMADTIAYRGPDSAGYWWDTEAGIALAHRRLAVVDLSASGHQPMRSVSKRYVLAFNGEIYNHLGLREQLATAGGAPAWRGHSDTETLLAGFDAWGVEETLRRCAGMFAMAIWDHADRRLLLARDRFGEKPLYFGRQAGGGTQGSPALLFGSELKALRAHAQFEGGIDRHALGLYFRHNNIPAPRTIHPGLHKVMPGTIVTIGSDLSVTTHPFWSTAESMCQAVHAPFTASDDEAADQLEARLARVIDLQSDADVPLGAFLSGGVDSSTVVALMQARARARGLSSVRTFSIGFDEDGYDEAAHAREVARHLGTHHTELYLTARQSMDTIPMLCSVYDEPFSDSSQIPMMLVSRLARQHVTVALSGDGGDELFAGYHRHHFAALHWPGLCRMPLALRRPLAGIARRLPPTALDRLAGGVGLGQRLSHAGEKLGKVAKVLDVVSVEDLYTRLLSQWDEPLVIGEDRPDGIEVDPALVGLAPAEWMMALDLLHYLPGDVLTKVDRAGMAASLEVRVPFLDHELARFAWSLPLHMKLRDGLGKWLLRRVLYRHVPASLIERPKMGFAVPIGQWLKGPLRDWAEALLSPARLKAEGLLREDMVRQAWAQHLAGQADHQHRLWSVLMFQQWLAHQKAA